MEKKETWTRRAAHWKRALSVAAALVFVLGGTILTRDSLSPRVAAQQNSTGSIYGSAYDDAVYEEASYDAGTGDVMMLTSGATSSENVAYSRSAKIAADMTAASAATEQKISRSASLTIGTQAYDESLAALRTLCEENGGWVSYSSESVTSGGSRRAYLTLRIPSDQLDAYLEGSGALGRVTSRDESATDLTDSYYDVKSRLETQQALMTRLQALVTDAASLSDLLALESQIAETQYNIDSLQSNLNNTDQQVDYAFVSITLKEETSAADISDSEKSLVSRIAGALETGLSVFVDFAEDVVVFLAAALPFIAIVVVVWLIARIIRKRRKA